MKNWREREFEGLLKEHENIGVLRKRNKWYKRRIGAGRRKGNPEISEMWKKRVEQGIKCEE